MNYLITWTSRLSQTRKICDMQYSAPVGNEVCLFQGARRDRNNWSSRSKNVGKKFVSHRKNHKPTTSAHGQQPPRDSLFHCMTIIADGGLRKLHDEDIHIATQALLHFVPTKQNGGSSFG